ncbi:ZC3H3 protein, partial [Galbula dea]|nr:ZC3H3 protein [Galbula dea]
SASASAVVLKPEPQQQHPLVFPDHQAARPLPRRRAEVPAPGQPSEQLRGAPGVAKLFGSGEMSSRPAPAAALVVGMTPSKSKFPPVSKAAVLQRSASASVSSKSPRFRRTTYTWVANPGKCSRAGRRWGSPRASENVKRASGGADRAAKPPPKADVGAKLKKSTLQSKLGLSPSKYKWKASSLQTSPSTSRSAFRWQSEEQKKPPAGSLPRAGAVSLPAVPGGLGGAKACGDAMVSSYKVKSRTKIIKRKGSSRQVVEKRSSSSSSTPLKSHFQLRRKNSSRGKASTTPKRSSARGMVQVSKHRLCRLPATRVQVSTKEGASLQLLRSSPAHRVIQTRYRIVKRNVMAAASSSSCLPSWKPRRPVTSR